MRASYVTAYEYHLLGIGEDGVDASEAAELARLNDSRPGFCERRHQAVRLSQHCGVVRIGQRALEVLPKIDGSDSAEGCRKSLLHMLRMVGHFPVASSREVGHSLD